jgi:hypothetical protein
MVEDEDNMQTLSLAALLLCAALTCTDSVLAPDSPVTTSAASGKHLTLWVRVDDR